jgi:hypothetical protein
MVGDGALEAPAPFINRLFTSSFGLVPEAGEGEDGIVGVLDLEGDLIKAGLTGTPLLAGIVPNDLTLDASEDIEGTATGLDESGAGGSAIDPKDSPAAMHSLLIYLHEIKVMSRIHTRLLRGLDAPRNTNAISESGVGSRWSTKSGRLTGMGRGGRLSGICR